MRNWLKLAFGGADKPMIMLAIKGENVPIWRKGKSPISDVIEATGAEPGDTVAIDHAGHARIVGRPLRVVIDKTTAQLHGQGMGSYMYDEHHYGSVPTSEQAKKILADYDAGRVVLAPLSEPGAINRLKTIAAGGEIDPVFFPAR